MAVGTTVSTGMSYGGLQRTAIGSVKSDWIVANSNLAAANSATELLRPGATDDSNVTPITIPEGATTILFRTRRVAAATTLTTHPILRFWVIDGSADGVPTRIDNVDSSATGITSTATSSDASDAAGVYLYSDPIALTGYDLQCGQTLYVLVETAANYSASTSVAGMVLFR